MPHNFALVLYYFLKLLFWLSQILLYNQTTIARCHHHGFTLTLCKSMGFIIVPWKNSTVVKWRLNSPSNSRSGGLLCFFLIFCFEIYGFGFLFRYFWFIEISNWINKYVYANPVHYFRFYFRYYITCGLVCLHFGYRMMWQDMACY